MDIRLCNNCNEVFEIKDVKTFSYDPIVSVEVVTYYCPKCKVIKRIENLKQL